MNKNIPFLRGFVFITVGLLLGTIMLLIIDKNQVPAKAQAQELFELYIEMDNARQESAQIFAELMLVVRNPERAGSVDDIGAKPSLSPKEELVVRLQENRVLVEQTLNTINADKFTDPEVEL